MNLVLAHWARGLLAGRIPFVNLLTIALFISGPLVSNTSAQIQPLVAIHDSELTRFLDSSNAPAVVPTPMGTNTTGLQWWVPDWHYFVMPESLKEAMRSDGTAFAVVGDSNIVAGTMLTNGVPKYPILISLACEAIRDDEIAPLTNYVAAGGFLLAGSSAFTRNTNGTTRGDFAFANELGIHMLIPGVTNWILNNTFTKQQEHRLISHIPGGELTWRIPSKAEEISWGVSPNHNFLAPHDIWRVASSDAVVLATGDSLPYLLVKKYGKGWFIYCAQLQPLIGHGGFAPGMYAYVVFRKAIEWAFESNLLPVPKLSPWPYQYDAAFMVRHDLENFTNEIAAVAASAQVEFTNGARGDYYFCTGTLRDDAPAAQTNAIIAGLRQAITNFGATIGPHNGGLRNPYNFSLQRGDYDWWHWGLDEVLDVTPTNYPSGKAYAQASVSNAFNDVESWLSGITNGIRAWVGCYFNSTREDSYAVQAQAGVKIAGDQKLTPFPHWTVSTRTPGLLYPFVTEPVSDWFIGGLIAQSVEPWHPPAVYNARILHDAVDFYYNLGALINIYSHTLSTGMGDGGQLAVEYLTYGANTNLHPRLWTSGNAVNVYRWWVARSTAQITATYSTNGSQSIASISVAGATDTNTSVEVVIPASGSPYDVQVFTNSVLAGSDYRTNNQGFKIRVGTSITNAQVRYVLGPKALNDNYTLRVGEEMNVPTPGVLGNDLPGIATNLTAILQAGPTNGSLKLDTNGGFEYAPYAGYAGSDSFTYQAVAASGNASVATVSIIVSPTDTLFSDNFSRTTNAASVAPWVIQSGNWAITNGVMQAGTNVLNTYGFAYITNRWINYAVEARIQFPAGAFGGGISGRLDPPTGKRYVAWIYPDGSAGGSNVLKLLKFQSWTAFTVLQQTNLPSVGTNWHTTKLAFQGNRISVYFDTNQLMSVTDGPPPYPSGSISLDMSTYLTPYIMSVDDVVVRPLVAEENFTVDEDTLLSVSAPGVLANDTEVFGTNLAAVLVSGPTNGLLNFGSDGSFTYLPSTNYYGNDSFVYQALDGPTNLGSATVMITVTPVNDAPILPLQTNRTIAQFDTLIVTNAATDVDLPQDDLSYNLLDPPAGAMIDANGVITWTPEEIQAPSTNTITTIVSDDGEPPLSATNSFLVFVRDTNSPPVLPPQPNRTINELALFAVTNTASDENAPPLSLTYHLESTAPNAKIDANGVIRWIPPEWAGPGIYEFTTIVSDSTIPPRSATNTFIATVNEVNSPPELPPVNNITMSAGRPLTVSNVAFDSDDPANTFTYELLTAPTNATIDFRGLIMWVPGAEQVPSTNLFTTKVTDFNPVAITDQHLSATNSFTVIVLPPGMPPIIESITLNNGQAIIICSSAVGSTYRLQTKDNLDDADWNDVGPDIIATNISISATNILGTSQTRFYRIFQVQ